MILTLEVQAVAEPEVQVAVPPDVGVIHQGTRKVFEAGGGTIGRLPDNTWVLPASSVSGHHATICCHDGVFSIEDTSRFGVFINSDKHPLGPDRPHPIVSGDQINIGPYRIGATVTAGVVSDEDPFAPLAKPAVPLSSSPARKDLDLDLGPGSRQAEQKLDPLKALGLDARLESEKKRPVAEALQEGLGLDQHYSPPEPETPVEAEESAAGIGLIPDDYDPLAKDGAEPAIAAEQKPNTGEVLSGNAMPPLQAMVSPEVAPDTGGHAVPASRARLPLRVGQEDHEGGRDVGLAGVLAGAGLEDVEVTPGFGRTLGRVLQVVVSGVMQILRTRQDVRDEFRMLQSRLMPAANNPLKFSVDAQDALHDLFVKRSDAYLEPVAAFEEAFQDLRDHQLAELKGMQMAFQVLLADLHPDRLEQQFNRELGKGLLPRALRKLRYWDLYCDRANEIIENKERSFQQLFAERFGEAYDEELERLRRARRNAKGS